ncbi:MAG: substrate-binding domain-containing protein, partial [Mogibacterium sp.]|nr:substrate-binding domain-containing protein [Mogibacterium sp.]
FMKLHPDVSVTVRISDFLEDTTARLARGEIDFVACLDEEYAYPEFLTMAKRPEKIVFVTYPGNPLTKRQELKASDVVKDQFIVADRDISYCALLDKDLRKQGIEMIPAMEIGSVGAIISMLLKGYGCSFVPEFAVSDYLDKGELELLNVSDIDIRICSYFICSKDRWINPVMREFIRVATSMQI